MEKSKRTKGAAERADLGLAMPEGAAAPLEAPELGGLHHGLHQKIDQLTLRVEGLSGQVGELLHRLRHLA